MIIFKDKGYMTNSIYPGSDWTGEAKIIVEDGSELAKKIQQLYPYYDFVLDNEGNLVDVVAIEKPPEPEPTDEEKQAAYDILSIQYIHEKYSYDEENKIMREYLADMDNPDRKSAFNVYNAYVEECKRKAHAEVYGEL